MWSVKTWPKPGSCSSRARSSARARRRPTELSSMVRSLMIRRYLSGAHGDPTSEPVGQRRRERRRRRPRGCCAGRRPRVGEVGRDGLLDRAAAAPAGRGARAAAPTDRIVAVGSAMPLPAMSGAEPCTGSNIDGLVPLDVDVAAGRQPDAAGDRGGEVGEDVAEQVVGDDDVEALRLGHQEHRRRVDVQVVGGDVRELRADLRRRCAPRARRRARARWSCAPG